MFCGEPSVPTRAESETELISTRISNARRSSSWSHASVGAIVGVSVGLETGAMVGPTGGVGDAFVGTGTGGS